MLTKTIKENRDFLTNINVFLIGSGLITITSGLILYFIRTPSMTIKMYALFCTWSFVVLFSFTNKERVSIPLGFGFIAGYALSFHTPLSSLSLFILGVVIITAYWIVDYRLGFYHYFCGCGNCMEKVHIHIKKHSRIESSGHKVIAVTCSTKPAGTILDTHKRYLVYSQ